MLRGSSQQSWTSGPKVKGGGPVIFRRTPFITGVSKRYYTSDYYYEMFPAHETFLK